MARTQYDLQNPVTQHPKAGFPKQPQPEPGLAQHMQPKPDHGESTYKGLRRLKGRKALVTGADSGDGIRVNAVAPGPVWTPLQPSKGQPKEAIPEFGNHTPLGRPGQPAEVAPLYVFLASQESSYVTAETYGVTGG